MTREDIIRMAREVGLLPTTLGPTIQTRYAKAKEQALERFFHMAQAAEREACAKFIEDDYVRQFEEPWRQNLANAIRARGQS
jgi:hypothetical protein